MTIKIFFKCQGKVKDTNTLIIRKKYNETPKNIMKNKKINLHQKNKDNLRQFA